MVEKKYDRIKAADIVCVLVILAAFFSGVLVCRDYGYYIDEDIEKIF